MLLLDNLGNSAELKKAKENFLMRSSFVTDGQGLQKMLLLRKLQLDFALGSLEDLDLDTIMSWFVSVRHLDLT